MPITTDASKREHRALVKDFIRRLGEDAKGITAEINFGEEDVEFKYEGSRYLVPHSKFNDWASNGFPFTKTGSPQLGRWREENLEPGDPPRAPEKPKEAPQEKPAPKPRKAPRAKQETKEAAPQAKPKGRPKAGSKPKPTEEAVAAPKAPPTKRATPPTSIVQAASEFPEDGTVDQQIEFLTKRAYEIEAEEEQGTLGANAARYKRGALVLMLDRVKDRAKAEGREELATRKALLDLLNRGQLGIADNRDTLHRFKPLSEDEATVMSKVVDKFCAGDITSRFRLLDTINPNTGEPLVSDGGEELRIPITEVAPNKLYPLVRHVPGESSDDFHRMVSFAHNYSEGNVKSVVNLAAKLNKPVLEVVKQVMSQRRRHISATTDNEVRASLDDDALKLWIKDQAPPAPPSPYYNITTERGFGESVWEPLKGVLSAINEKFGFATANETTGEVSSIFVFERTITQFFNPHEEEGYQAILGALVKAGDLTEDQAAEMVDVYGFDSETNGLRERSEEEREALFGAEEAEDDEGNPVEPEPDEQEGDGDDWGDDGDDDPPFDADLDIDTPESEGDEDGEGSDPDDF